ncbi:capsular polysaccharide biosynthesis [Fictibacillus macauensis ZFHKF-1]|uniref:non-specific protein-tyrosine kinase n=1 Tax=Fictibacillus macauensis ZFHKF-1 TaxID=1196324 RepID=I8AF56_9BACL|nr:CpsD/CapB family tyrosine-protein kinase [Fictibacillus macauensis]EIT83969.1 capsular polysaccharide biosynthesis [Fictibacillus macauensis ZFHKF-1]
MKRKFRKSLTNLGKRALIAHNNPKSPISERYRAIRTNIQFASIDVPHKTILVTSAGQAEGKSTTVANLAVVMAQEGKRVLLIDGDLRKPTVHYTFQLSNLKGVTNVLMKQIELKDAIQYTNVEHLFVLTSGSTPPNPSELLNSKAMETLISEVAEQFDYVLFDSPPLLYVTDAQVLANRCSGVVLVATSGQTEREEARKAKELLENASAVILGVVLNGKEVKRDELYYSYGYK